MRTEEIKETKVVGTRYVAEDGTIFYSQEECMKYEKSALFVARGKLKLIATTNEADLGLTGCYDDMVEIFDIQTQEDLDNLKAYLHLNLSTHGVRDMDYFFGENAELGFNNITLGHEVIIWWGYDQDYFTVYGDGSVDAYVNYARERALNVIEKSKPKKETESNE